MEPFDMLGRRRDGTFEFGRDGRFGPFDLFGRDLERVERDRVDLGGQIEHGPVASGADPFEYGRHPLADDRRVDLRAAEQIGPLAFWGIHRNSHQRIIVSSDSTRISSAPIALSCSILLHRSRSLITTCIELQPSCASGRIVGLFMPGRMRTASGIFA